MVFRDKSGSHRGCVFRRIPWDPTSSEAHSGDSRHGRLCSVRVARCQEWQPNMECPWEALVSIPRHERGGWVAGRKTWRRQCTICLCLVSKASTRHEVVPRPREGGESLRRSIAQVESLDTTEEEEIRKKKEGLVRREIEEEQSIQ
jgi:hypothetical protein